MQLNTNKKYENLSLRWVTNDHIGKIFSYNYPEQISYKEKVIQILENLLKELKQ